MPDTWDPSIPNQQVRCIDNPARTGMTTGRVKTHGSFTMVEVRFGPSEVSKNDIDNLEPILAGETPTDMIIGGKFGNAQDLRRLLTFQKIRGDLTSVFYSMESSNTDFYAHQFKPVLKFIIQHEYRSMEKY